MNKSIASHGGPRDALHGGNDELTASRLLAYRFPPYTAVTMFTDIQEMFRLLNLEDACMWLVGFSSGTFGLFSDRICS